MIFGGVQSSEGGGADAGSSVAGKKKIGGSFAPAGSGKTVRTSEFEHMKEYEFSTPGPKKIPKQVSSRRTPECFSKKLMYIEDAYERKEDMRKLDY